MDADASSNTPPRKRATEIHRYIPSEIVEQILLNLPVKSLLRFSSVSKLWNSMMSQQTFVNRYTLHLHGRERVFISNLICRRVSDLLSDDNPIKDVVDLDGPFFGMQIRAFCDELACVEKGNSLFISNPSTRAHRKLPPSPSQSDSPNFSSYGLGYDSVGDDYKLVAVHIIHNCFEFYAYRNCRVVYTVVEMYSLRSNSWKEIQPFPDQIEKYVSNKSWFVSGALHWLVWRGDGVYSVIFLDLSTEKYGEVMLPNKFVGTGHTAVRLNLDVAMGKLCLCVTNFCSLGLWMMEDYGDVGSWTEKFYVDCNAINIPMSTRKLIFWKLVYFCENVVILRIDFNAETNGIYVCKFDDKHKTLVLNKSCRSNIFSGDGGLFVESLVSPDTGVWPVVRT